MTETLFDQHAAGWDTPGRTALACSVAAEMRKRISLDDSMTLLDFGAGTGLLSLDLLDDAGKVIALDESAEMLAFLREKAGNRPGIETIAGDYREGVLDGIRVDGIVSSMVLHHVEDTGVLLKKLAGLLSPGGFIALADLEEEDGGFHKDSSGVYHRGFNREKLKKLLLESHFTDIAFYRVTEITKKQKDGSDRVYGVFLVTGVKE